ncbi:MAG: hypothetical protein K0V04_18235 [Deltaproteobacteria bacterium]|nr:hypothetical protein [Deltaproteobacteria bacterium]
MKRVRTAIAVLAVNIGGGCAAGAPSPIPFTTGAANDDGDTETDDTGPGIDLDGGGPPSPPGDSGGLPPPAGGDGDCCKANDTPGCENTPVQICVCGHDPWCCESEWDDACAGLIEELGCGHCNDPVDDGGEPPPPPPAGGDCCMPHDGPGCDEPEVERCVCTLEPACCQGHWGVGCTAVLELHGCGQCGGDPPSAETGDPEPPAPGDTGDTEPPPPPTNDCCDTSPSPGCIDASIQDCVCQQDPFCCDMAWDALCVDGVNVLACGTCEMETGSDGTTGDGPSACCEQQPGAGCPEPDIEACVCAEDPFCCDFLWDLTCVGEIEIHNCGSCS